MKTPILFFVAGAAAGASVMWFVQSAAPDSSGSREDKTASSAAKGSEEKKLTGRVQALEKELKETRSSAEKEQAIAPESGESGKQQRVFKAAIDDGRMEELMRQHAERDVNREVDRMALRLKLTAEQKESLRKFLMDGKDRESETFKAALKNGGRVESAPPGQSKDEFLKSILTPEQQADYAKSREEQRTARAEEYAQRKVRKLNNDLNLSEEQKDKLFQAYAHQKLAATDPAKSSEPGDVIGARAGGVVAFASGVAVGGSVEPMNIEFEDLTTIGGGDIERSSLESILTPEQLAVYDQRRTEEQEQAKKMIHADGLPLPSPIEGGAAAGAVLRIESEQRVTVEPAK